MDENEKTEPEADEYLPKKRNYRFSLHTRKKIAHLLKLKKYTSETDMIVNAIDALYESETHEEYSARGRKFE